MLNSHQEYRAQLLAELTFSWGQRPTLSRERWERSRSHIIKENTDEKCGRRIKTEVFLGASFRN